MLDDIGRSILDAATSAALGMNSEDRDKIMQKMMNGNANFNDYLTVFMMVKNQGGATTVMKNAASIPGLKNRLGMNEAEESEAKLDTASKIIAAMTEEEREQPGYFLYGQGVRARIAAVAAKAEVEEADVDDFLKQFKSMKDFFVRLGVGYSEGKSQEQLAKEMEKEFAEEGKTAAETAAKSKNDVTSISTNPERAARKAAKKAAQRAKQRIPPPLSARKSFYGSKKSRRRVRR